MSYNTKRNTMLNRFSSFAARFLRHKTDEQIDFMFYPPSLTARMAKVEKSQPLSATVVRRIASAYRYSIGGFQVAEQAMWGVIDDRRNAIHNALLSDGDDAYDLLSDPASTELYYGIDPLSGDTPPNLHIQIMDKVTRLAEAIGAHRAWYPEGRSHYIQHALPPELVEIDQLLEHISLKLNADLQFPTPFKGAVGVAASRGVVEYRAVQAIYQATRMRQLGGRSILEIGGGMGRTAYYALCLGAEKYTIIDIPLSIVGQALFLIAVLGPDSVSLPGEPYDGQPIRLLPPADIDDAQFDTVLNVDSLTEMSHKHIDQYVKFIVGAKRPFLSINHEANASTVRDVLGDALMRSPYWLRKGYVEELYSFAT